MYEPSPRLSLPFSLGPGLLMQKDVGEVFRVGVPGLSVRPPLMRFAERERVGVCVFVCVFVCVRERG